MSFKHLWGPVIHLAGITTREEARGGLVPSLCAETTATFAVVLGRLPIEANQQELERTGSGNIRARWRSAVFGGPGSSGTTSEKGTGPGGV